MIKLKRIRNFNGICLILGLMASSTVFAETRYVTDQLTVSLRSVPSDASYEILDKIRSGDVVEALQDKGGYTRIKTRGGSEGWVLSHYLVTKAPGGDGSGLRLENEKLMVRIRELESGLASRKSVPVPDPASVGKGAADAGSSAAENAAGLSSELSEVKEKYTRLLEQSKDVVALTQERNELRANLASLRTEVDYLRVEKERMSRAGLIRWFVAGAAVLIAGWLIGRASRKAKRFY